MTLLWFVSFLLFLFVELITINLVTIWFAIGSLAAMITSFITESYAIQVVVLSINLVDESE